MGGVVSDEEAAVDPEALEGDADDPERTPIVYIAEGGQVYRNPYCPRAIFDAV